METVLRSYKRESDETRGDSSLDVTKTACHYLPSMSGAGQQSMGIIQRSWTAIMGLMLVPLSILLESTASADPVATNNPFPSPEFYCASLYGSRAPGAAPYCSARFSQCLSAEKQAQTRLALRWPSLGKTTKDACLSRAKEGMSAAIAKNASVKRMSEEGGYWSGYSVVLAEQCVAQKLSEAAPAGMPPMPAACVAGQGVPLPAAESATAEQQCYTIVGGNASASELAACIARQKAAKAGISALASRLTPALVVACYKVATQLGFDGPLPYTSASFYKCTSAAIADWGTGR
jgi:hypothetical protein